MKLVLLIRLMLIEVVHVVGASVSATPSRSNQSCESGNIPTNRRCWTEGFDIDTNYYERWPETGVIREYWLSVENHTLAPVGTDVHSVLAVNGSVPGPTLYGDWGDTFVVHVTNNLQVNGTSIHWHGLRQLYTNQYDGIPGLTQCPQPPNSTRTYRFNATQYGSSWYHSHFTVQYGAGLYGGIHINGPATMNYDVDLGVLTLGDWFNEPTPFGVLIGVADAESFPVATGGILNGTNELPCDPKHSTCKPSKRFETTVKHGSSYRLRLVNVAVQNYYRFTIDNHRFWVIANDFVPVRPYNTDSVVLGQGQRFDIVFQADQSADNYWMRAMFQPTCGFPMLHPNHTLGIIRYEGSDTTADPTTTNYLMNDTLAGECGGEGYLDILEPWVPVEVGAPAVFREIDIAFSSVLGPDTFLINGTQFLVHWDRPSILELADGQVLTYDDDETRPVDTNQTLIDQGFDLPKQYNGSVLAAENIIEIEEKYNGAWAYFYINNHMDFNDWHPIHLHGHDFWVLSQGGGYWYPNNGTINTHNPPRRDVANLPLYGHLVIAAKIQNPGFWLMHCHIAWHVSEGLAWQFMARKDKILGLYDLELTRQQCEEWRTYVKSPERVWGQDDSGV